MLKPSDVQAAQLNFDRKSEHMGKHPTSVVLYRSVLRYPEVSRGYPKDIQKCPRIFRETNHMPIYHKDRMTQYRLYDCMLM